MATSGRVNSSSHSTSLVKADYFQVTCHSSVSTSQNVTAFSGMCAAWHCGRAWRIHVIIRHLIFCPILPIILHAAWTRLSDALLFCNDGLCQLLNAVPLP
jgi:hypothetical protein